jgi:hypothetical protein
MVVIHLIGYYKTVDHLNGQNEYGGPPILDRTSPLMSLTFEKFKGEHLLERG